MEKQRVVITGRGVMSPLGNSVDEFWQNLQQGNSGVKLITDFDTSKSHCRIAGLISGYVPEDHFQRRELRSYERFTQLGLLAAQQAIKEAGLSKESLEDSGTGVIMGTGIGGIGSYAEAYDALFAESEERPINAYTIPRIMNSAVSSATAIRFGIRGPNLTLNTACSSGGNAIGQAMQWIREGRLQTVICGASEAPVTYGLLRAWDALGVLCRHFNDEPEKACRPFSKDRHGFVLSEGAAVLVLESLSSAQKRNAPIFAEMAGFASNCDASSMTNPDPSGVTEAMQQALVDADVSVEDVDYVNAHGTGTRMNDPVECQAIQKVFAEKTANLPVSSSKSMLGHTMGASSALETLVTQLAIEKDCAPPTINLDTPDPECPVDPVPHEARKFPIHVAMTNSFAFGGSNAVLVLKKWKP